MAHDFDEASSIIVEHRQDHTLQLLVERDRIRRPAALGALPIADGLEDESGDPSSRAHGNEDDERMNLADSGSNLAWLLERHFPVPKTNSS